jgi:hypothetical protein
MESNTGHVDTTPPVVYQNIITMKFHFVRTTDSDITVTGKTVAECTQKAFDERMKQVTPTKIQGEVIE